VAWSSGRINKLNANWANSFGLDEFFRMKSGERFALDDTMNGKDVFSFLCNRRSGRLS